MPTPDKLDQQNDYPRVLGETPILKHKLVECALRHVSMP